MTSAASQLAMRDLVRRCHGGLDASALPGDVLPSLRRLVPFDAAFVASADPQTLLFTHAYAEAPLDTATPQFIANEFAGGDVNTFAGLATSASHIATLDEATCADRAASPRYRDIIGPLGLGDELRAALVLDGACWGYLCLHREDGPSGFTAAEAALLTMITPHLAHAMRAAVIAQAHAATGGPRRPGVVVLGEDLGVVAVTPEAAQLLELVVEGRVRALPMPVCVYSVAATLRAIERDAAPWLTVPSARVRAVDGTWLMLHASRLNGPGDDGLITVVVQDADPASTLPLLLSAHGLSPREVEVARLVLRGTTTRLISSTLRISEYTVQDHLKSIFDKTGVRSRAELIGQLLH